MQLGLATNCLAGEGGRVVVVMQAITLSETSDRDSSCLGLICSRQTALPTECVAYLTHIEINLIKNGAVTCRCSGNKIEVGGGRFVAFWAAVPHQTMSVTSDAEYFVMNIPFKKQYGCARANTETVTATSS